MRRTLFIAVLLGGCHFGLHGLGSDNGSAGGDDAGSDDDGGSDDLGPSTAGDMGGFLPSHVPPGTLSNEASDLPLGITAIDTSSLTINGAAPPAGVVFVPVPGHDEWAELVIGGWTVDQNVKVTGARALIVVAARKVDVAAIIDGSANQLTAGPGATTAGKGGDGQLSGDNDSGGGGAGFGSAGAQGGDSLGNLVGGTAGSSFGDTRTFFGGGSPGGIGGGAPDCGATEMTKGRGGAGGGAIQISSALEVVVEASGGVNVGGGGGTGGCGSLASAGGGGGSGGTVFLEAPAVTVLGKLGANGGGGGGGGSGNGNNDGTDGANGGLSQAVAAGGKAGGGGFLSSSNGGDGGGGAAVASGAVRGANQENGGGAGGGTGRIWLRTPSGETPVIGGAAMMSPSPTIDATL